MGQESLEQLLNSWAHSPTAHRLRPGEDGVETGHDFLGEINIDLLLAPSPPPPPAPGPPPVEDSTGSGTAGAAPQSSAPMSVAHATSPAMPVSSGLGQKQHLALAQQAAALAHQQQAAVSNQGHHLHGSYMLPMAAASSGTLPGFDPSPHMMPQQHGGGMLQLSQGGGDMTQHYMPPPTAYPQQHGGPLVLPALTAVPAGSSQQQGLSEATADGKRRRGPRPRVFKKHTCQSDGCTVDLAPLSFYLQRNHICPDHLKADSYLVRGVASRFCQRCGQGHPLTEFEGSKRSCRKALERHNQRRRDKQAASTATGPQAAPQAQAPAQPQVAAAIEPAASLPAVLANGDSASLATQQMHVASTEAMMGAWLDDPFGVNAGGLQHSMPLPEKQVHDVSAAAQQAAAAHAQAQAQAQAQAHAQAQAQAQAQLSMSLPQAAASPYGEANGHGQEWVMLPRGLLEQQAPHLLASAVPAPGPPPVWQLHQAQHQSPAQRAPSQHQSPPQRAPPQHQSPQAPLQRLQHPVQQGLGPLEQPSYSLWQGEVGGSGI